MVFNALCFVFLANTPENTKRMKNVEDCFGSSGQVSLSLTNSFNTKVAII